MKEMTLAQMETIEGGSLEAAACGLGFAQLSFWNGLAFGLAEVSLGVTLGVVAVIDVTGAIVCSTV